MNKFFQWLFKEFTPLKDVYTDSYTIFSHISGGILISSAFIIIGLIFILLSSNNVQTTARRQRILTSKLIGWSLVICGISRGVDVLAVWYNYGNLNGLLKQVTGVIGYITMFYIPYVLRVIRRQSTLTEVKDVMVKTTQTMEELKEISKTLKK